LTTRIIWAQVQKFERFDACFCICALIIWSVLLCREPQRRLNNAIKEIVKKEVLKLLHPEIIYPVPHSEWVSPIQVVPKKGGMAIVKNEKNKLIPQRTVIG
jgi:hypothetical protein